MKDQAGAGVPVTRLEFDVTGADCENVHVFDAWINRVARRQNTDEDFVEWSLCQAFRLRKFIKRERRYERNWSAQFNVYFCPVTKTVLPSRDSYVLVNCRDIPQKVKRDYSGFEKD